MTLRIRQARPEDGEELARAWLEGGRELAALDPGRFRVPDEEGLVGFIGADLAGTPPDVELFLVAELDGRIVGSVGARLLEAIDSARYQVMMELREVRVFVDHVSVDAPFRRRGIGTELMANVERWAREHHAVSIGLDTYADSPLSVPFYEALGYSRTSLRFEKSLDSLST